MGLLKPQTQRLLDNQLKRWYKLKPVPIQLQLVADPARFIVVPAGRRSGKTERAKRKVIKACMANPDSLYFIAAPTYAQVKKIYWKDCKRMALTAIADKSPSESELIIYFNNGSELHLIGLDKPDRIEGVPWDGGIIDEAATVKEMAWESSIYPALQTYDPSREGRPKPWCWIIGRPKGRNWFYRLFKYATESGDPEWAGYTWFSSLVLPKETIDSAKRKMDAKLFRQEFEAAFETTSGLIYEDYNELNYTNEEILPHELIHYFCDFNFTPMSHGIAVYREHHSDIATKKTIKAFYILDDIVLESAVGEHNALEFVERYKDHKNKRIRLYGDRSGRNGEKHSLASEYANMEKVFKDNGWEVDRRVKSANPGIKDSQNAVRAKICNAYGVRTLYVNPNKAKWMHEGLSTVMVKEGSSFIEDDKNKYQHITTALRYMVDYEEPIENGIIEDLGIREYGDYPEDDEYTEWRIN